SEYDSPVPADFDGDGKIDLAVFHNGTQTGQFVIRPSGGGADRTIDLGQDLDDFTVTGDYDGDGKADPAVFRVPLATPGDGFFIYHSSKTDSEVSVKWGFGSKFADPENCVAYPGDFDGDGKYDF